MDTYFASNYTGDPFVIFGPPHLAALSLIMALCVWVSFWKPDEVTKVRFRRIVAIILALNEVVYHSWHLYHGTWAAQEMLPLHVCSVIGWLAIYMLFTGNYFMYDYLYFLGLTGASQALLTPNLGVYGFPHYRFFQTMISHGLLFMSPFFVTFVEGYRPTWRALGKTILALNVYMILIAIFNGLTGSNFMFIAHKPDTPSLLDVLGPWPIYIIWAEVIGLSLAMLTYIPWAIYDWKKASTERSTSVS